jgi:DHA1 family tetracycline resistance protein-like MFS transporter
VLVTLGLLATPATASLPVLLVALALLAIGSGINNPSNQSIVSKLAPADQVGGVMGVNQSLGTLGRILGPLVGGAAFQYLGMASPYWIGAAATAVAFVLSLSLPKIQEDAEREQPRTAAVVESNAPERVAKD